MLDIKRLTEQLLDELEDESIKTRAQRQEIILLYMASIYHGFDIGEATEQGRVFVKDSYYGQTIPGETK